jgi:NAD-dependent SIR2 family protein deacetylase
LFDEAIPWEDRIVKFKDVDLRSGLGIFLISGTSLKIPGTIDLLQDCRERCPDAQIIVIDPGPSTPPMRRLAQIYVRMNIEEWLVYL